MKVNYSYVSIVFARLFLWKMQRNFPIRILHFNLLEDRYYCIEHRQYELHSYESSLRLRNSLLWFFFFFTLYFVYGET